MAAVADTSIHFPLMSTWINVNSPFSPKSKRHHFRGLQRMQFTKKKLIPILVLILSGISILRLLKISIVASSSSSSTLLPSILPGFILNNDTNQHMLSYKTTMLTDKEFGFLSNLISQKSPCKLLVFGFQPQYLELATMNGEGYTVFLEDNPEKIASVRTILKPNSTMIYKVRYNVPAKDAFEMLKHGREDPECAPNSRPMEESSCKLALKKLPREVYENNWDVVVVDAPSGDTLESPGRMGAIYSAAILARAGNSTDVVVHDVDRTVEKWFSWEFLCDENLVSSKGRLWDFRITGGQNSTSFCSTSKLPQTNTS